jgi:hypothetical protein
VLDGQSTYKGKAWSRSGLAPTHRPATPGAGAALATPGQNGTVTFTRPIGHR